MPCRRTRRAHDLDRRLFFGLLFLENFDLSQLKKPPFAFNSNSTGKWSLTPSACKGKSTEGWEPPALSPSPAWVCSVRCGEVACGHCIGLGAMVSSVLVLQAVQHCLDTAGSVFPCQPFPSTAGAVLCLPAPQSSEIPPENQRC